jgi:hypothetical protein
MRALKHAAVPTPPAKVGPSNIPAHEGKRPGIPEIQRSHAFFCSV